MQQENGNSEREVVIKARGMSKSFGDHTVIRKVSFDLHKKENIVILGKSGTGKSVLIKSLVGLHEPDSGELTVLGNDVSNMDKDELDLLRLRIGYLFQGGALYDSMSVKENLLFPLERQTDPPSKEERLREVEEALENVGLRNAIDKMPSELSGGMKKRIALARTLILKPDIVLYDEPTTGLDPVTSQEISQLILKMQDKYGISSIIITHDITCTRTVADRIFIIKNGKFEVEGTFDELSNSDDPWVKAFFQ
jgi:phospholipid/cholesterol/gamma-HCH transport system ATP-binding protein